MTELRRSTEFRRGSDGLDPRTAWAGEGDGVLFIDANGNGRLDGKREYAFTEWDKAA